MASSGPVIHHPTDAELVEWLRSGCEQAVEHLLARYHAPLLAYAFRLLQDRQAAEDVIQEALVRFLDHLHSLRESDKLRSYLYMIVTRCCRDYQRKPARREVAVEISAELSLDTSVNATERYYVASLLKQLSPPHAEVLILRFYEDMELESIADILGVPLGTVKSRLHYALGQLRKLVSAEPESAKAGVCVHGH